MQHFDETEKKLLIPAALFAAAYASEQKDDNGSVYVSFKYPEHKRSFTAICETDGRIRGYREDYIPPEQNRENILLITGVRLSARGDYQSAVTARDVGSVLNAFFQNSSQTEAEIRLTEKDGNPVLVLSLIHI